MRVVLICRIIKQIITTFSNTVVATAALTDVLSGNELALGLSSFAGSQSLNEQNIPTALLPGATCHLYPQSLLC